MMINKYKILLLGASLLASVHISIAIAASECDSTWDKSSAAMSCGSVCTNPHNVYHYNYYSSYDKEKDECTFNAGCCQHMPYQICSYQYAVCSPTAITVKRGDSQFQNVYGQLKHEG